MTKIRLTLEAAGPTKKKVLQALDLQASQFFGDEPYRLEGPIEFEVEQVVKTVQEILQYRWSAVAHYVNKESNA